MYEEMCVFGGSGDINLLLQNKCVCRVMLSMFKEECVTNSVHLRCLCQGICCHWQSPVQLILVLGGSLSILRKIRKTTWPPYIVCKTRFDRCCISSRRHAPNASKMLPLSSVHGFYSTLGIYALIMNKGFCKTLFY